MLRFSQSFLGFPSVGLKNLRLGPTLKTVKPNFPNDHQLQKRITMKPLRAALACTLALQILGGLDAAASQTATLNVGVQFQAPMSVSCNTNIRGGIVSVKDGSIFGAADVANRSWVVGTEADVHDSASGLSVINRSPGSCKITGLASSGSGQTVDIAFESDAIDLTSTDTSVVLQAYPKLPQPGDIETQVSSATVDIDSQTGQNSGYGYIFLLSDKELVFPVGLEVVIPQDATAQTVVGDYSGAVTVVVSL